MIADHVVPHRENRGAFWDGALQSLCKPCHDGAKQREEQGRGKAADLGAAGAQKIIL
jgi:5-methylcytosine-specific restriction endonuclease McrA